MAVKTTIRTPMPVKMRAKQFAMFDALKGLTEAIADKERIVALRRELSETRIEEIDHQLRALKIGDKVTVSYYCYYGKQYRTITEKVMKIDLFWKEVQLGETIICFSEIEDIRVVEP